MTFQSLLMSFTQESSQKMEWLLILLFVVVVQIIPSAICHKNEMGGSKTPSHHKRKKKKKKIPTQNTQHWETANWRQQSVQRLWTQVELCAEQFKYYRFPTEHVKDFQWKTEIQKKETRRNVPQKKMFMNIVQDLPSCTEDPGSGIKQMPLHFAWCRSKICAKSPRWLENSKGMHNPGTD